MTQLFRICTDGVSASPVTTYRPLVNTVHDASDISAALKAPALCLSR